MRMHVFLILLTVSLLQNIEASSSYKALLEKIVLEFEENAATCFSLVSSKDVFAEDLKLPVLRSEIITAGSLMDTLDFCPYFVVHFANEMEANRTLKTLSETVDPNRPIVLFWYEGQSLTHKNCF